MNTSKTLYAFILILLPCNFHAYVNAEQETIQATHSQFKLNPITIKTNDDLINCTIQPFTEEEAKELFGSTGPLNCGPQDHYTIYKNNDLIYILIFGDSHSELTNGFTNLHGRFIPFQVSITNKSATPISIPKIEKTGEHYLKIKNRTFEPQSEVLKRYKRAGILTNIGLHIAMTGSALISATLFYNLYTTTPRDPGGLILVGSMTSIISGILAFQISNNNKRAESHDNLETQFRLLNDDSIDTNEHDFITIPSGATFSDLVFINRADYGDSYSLEGELIFVKDTK